MKKFLFITISLIFTFSNLGHAFEIFSVRPCDIYPGSEITVYGKNLSADITLTLANRDLKPIKATPDKLKFFIPKDLEPGIYNLKVRREGKDNVTTLTIPIKKSEFSVKRYSPEIIDRCSTGNISINVEGENLDLVKKITSSDFGTIKFFSSKDNLNLELELDKALSLYSTILNIYLHNDDEKIKEVIPIRINNKPFIESIDIFERDVTSLTLRIRGKNFIYPIKLFVNDEIIREKERNVRYYYNQKASPTLDNFEFISCNEIMYKIYPTVFDSRNIFITIENPTGEKSNTYSITIP